MIIGHGGNKQDLAEALECSIDRIIDMSSNLNPLGPPDTVTAFIRDNVEKIESLPLPDAAGMRKGFARFHNMDENRVIAGSGTTWFIYTLPKALGAKRVLITGPTYSDYQDACIMHGIDYTHYISDPADSFVPDMDQISSLAEKSDMVFLCNPNNPTGVLVEKQKIEYLVKKHEQTLFVVDESYLPFVEKAEEYSFTGDTRYKNVLVLSSMSKIFRIPGLRTGFLSADPDLTDKVMAHYQPWCVNSLAQAVIENIFENPEQILPFYEKTREFTQTEKRLFCDSLANISGIELVDGETYFVLARLTGPQRAPEFCKKIGKHKILIRNCSNFEGLSDEYVRFSLKDREENSRLSSCIKTALQEA